MIKKLLYGALSGVLLTAMTFAAQAAPQDPVINFDQSTGVAASGTLSYNGNGGPAVGDSITFDILTGKNTPSNGGVAQNLSCDPRCQLNFNTGDNTSEGPSTWQFGGGGTFTLTGTVNDQSGDTVASGTLLDGSFLDQPTVSGSEVGGAFTFTGFGQDTQAQGISDYFGIENGLTFRFVNTDIVATGGTVGDNNSFSGDVNNADITNTPEGVPEPGVFGVFGLALVMLGGFLTLRRKNLQF